MFFTPADMAMNIFGMPLFIDYYTVHDPESGNVGWAPHSASNKGDVTRGTPPTAQFLELGQINQNSGTESIMISWALTILTCYVIYDLWYSFMRESWQNALEEWLFITVTALFFAAIILMAIFLLQPLMYAAINTTLTKSTAEASLFSSKSVKEASLVDSLNYDGKAMIGLGLGVLMVFGLKKSGLLEALKAKMGKKTATSTDKTSALREEEELSTEDLLAQVLSESNNLME